jgi:hypothetical protein
MQSDHGFDVRLLPCLHEHLHGKLLLSCESEQLYRISTLVCPQRDKVSEGRNLAALRHGRLEALLEEKPACPHVFSQRLELTSKVRLVVAKKEDERKNGMRNGRAFPLKSAVLWIVAAVLLLGGGGARAQNGVMMQYFHWYNSSADNLWLRVVDQSDELAAGRRATTRARSSLAISCGCSGAGDRPTGQGAQEGNLNDVWVASAGKDGAVWRPVTGQAQWLPRNGHASVVFHGRMWVIGGWSHFIGGTSVNDLWSSGGPLP